MLAGLVEVSLLHEDQAEVVLGASHRQLVVQQLVDRDRLLRIRARPRQVAEVLVRAAEIPVHLAQAAEVLELPRDLDRLRVVLDGLRPVVQH